MDPPCQLCTYTQVFAFNIIVNGKRNPGAHQNIMSPARPPLLCTTKGGGPRLGVERIAIGQFEDCFRRQIDREAVARMCGQHQMNPIN